MATSADIQGVNLDCGIAYERLQGWLEDELALPCEDGAYAYRFGSAGCSVRIEPLEPRCIGRVSIQRTGLHVEGSSVAVEPFMRAFTLRFISAGG